MGILKVATRYLSATPLRKLVRSTSANRIEREFDPIPGPPIWQDEHLLSLEKIYLLGWMNATGKNEVTLDDVKTAPFLSNLQDTPSCKLIKQKLYSSPAKKLSAQQLILDVENMDRLQIPTHVDVIDRGQFEPFFRRITRPVLSIFNAYWEKTRITYRPVMKFEVDWFEALKARRDMWWWYEYLIRQNPNKGWPKTSSPQRFKTGWITFEINLAGEVTMLENQAPVEEVFVWKEERMFRLMQWRSFMMQKFLQRLVLRGFTRFKIPTQEKRKSMTRPGLVTWFSSYSDLPKIFNFKKEGDFWVLDLSQFTR